MVIPCKAAATCISDNIGKNSVTELPRDLSVRSSRTYRCTRTLTYTDRYHIPRVLTDKGNRSRFFGLTWSLEQTYQLIGPRLGGKVPDGGYNQIHAHTHLYVTLVGPFIITPG